MEDKKIKVLFTTNIPSPYRIKFFSELGKKCDLTVLFEKASSNERDSSWNDYSFEGFNGIILEGHKTDKDKAFAPSVIKYIKKDTYDAIIVTNPITPTGMFAIFYMKINGILYYVEGDGAFPSKASGIKGKLKQFLFNNTKGCFSTSKMHDQYYISYGVDANRIIRYPFSSIYESEIISKPLTSEQKRSLKSELGLPDLPIIVAVGQMIRRKGFDVLLAAWKSANINGLLCIIGGNPTDEYISFIRDNSVTNVQFIGFQTPEKLKKYYRCSELFVMPTREDIWGLVVNEAMSQGLPVISTDKCLAAVELVVDGENGYIVESENIQMLSNALIDALNNKEKLGLMGKKSIEVIRKYTIESMVERHINVLKLSSSIGGKFN